jgi:hypothetical protein
VPFNDVADLLACAMLLVLTGTIFGIFESPEECVLDFDDMKVYTRYESFSNALYNRSGASLAYYAWQYESITQYQLLMLDELLWHCAER